MFHFASLWTKHIENRPQGIWIFLSVFLSPTRSNVWGYFYTVFSSLSLFARKYSYKEESQTNDWVMSQCNRNSPCNCRYDRRSNEWVNPIKKADKRTNAENSRRAMKSFDRRFRGRKNLQRIGEPRKFPISIPLLFFGFYSVFFISLLFRRFPLFLLSFYFDYSWKQNG